MALLEIDFDNWISFVTDNQMGILGEPFCLSFFLSAWEVPFKKFIDSQKWKVMTIFFQTPQTWKATSKSMTSCFDPCPPLTRLSMSENF